VSKPAQHYRFHTDEHGHRFNELSYRMDELVEQWVGCPRCGQSMGNPCRTPGGQITTHGARGQAFRILRSVALALTGQQDERTVKAATRRDQLAAFARVLVEEQDRGWLDPSPRLLQAMEPLGPGGSSRSWALAQQAIRCGVLVGPGKGGGKGRRYSLPITGDPA
jgi:hypothetical protein